MRRPDKAISISIQTRNTRKNESLRITQLRLGSIRAVTYPYIRAELEGGPAKKEAWAPN